MWEGPEELSKGVCWAGRSRTDYSGDYCRLACYTVPLAPFPGYAPSCGHEDGTRRTDLAAGYR